MSKYIDLEAFDDWYDDGYDLYANYEALYSAPTVYVDRPKGEWIDEANESDASFGIHDYICSNCNHYADDHIGGHMWYTMYKPNYCPNCGADMRERESE